MKTPLSISGILCKNQYLQILIISIFGYIASSLLYYKTFIFLKYFLIVATSLFALIRPFEGLCAIAFSMPLELFFSVTGDITAIKLFGGIVFAGWFMNFSLNRERQIYFPRIIILFFIFVLWGFSSFIWADYKNLVLTGIMVLVRFVGLLFLVQQLVKTERQLHFLILSNVVGAIIVGMIGLYQFWLDPHQRVTGLDAAGSSYTVHFGYSILLSVFYFLSRSLYGSSNYLKRFFFLVGFGILLISALATYTRSIMMGFGMCTLFLLCHSLKKRNYFTLAKVLLMFLIIFVIVRFVFPTYLYERLNTIVDLEGGSAGRGAGRLDIWSVYLINIIKNPLSGIVGVGFSNSYSHYDLFLDRAEGYGVYPKNNVALQSGRDIHNTYLQTFVELGFVGFAIFLLIILILSKQFYNSFKFVHPYSLTWQIGLVIALEFIAIFTGCTFVAMFNRKYFWFTISLVIAYIKIVGNSKKQIMKS